MNFFIETPLVVKKTNLFWTGSPLVSSTNGIVRNDDPLQQVGFATASVYSKFRGKTVTPGGNFVSSGRWPESPT
ncbi:MAG: hypothetical protein CMJ65_07015 [Planctomycetaceae bacterium]|nr:hypothetical protein [Planctomycetaceae bacterium]